MQKKSKSQKKKCKKSAKKMRKNAKKNATQPEQQKQKAKKKEKKKGKKRDSPLNRLEAPQKIAALLPPRQNLSLSKNFPLAKIFP